MKDRTFLTAEWRYLAILNYAVDRAALKQFVPAGVELDCFRGDAFVESLSSRPSSAFIADGSPVPVRRASEFSALQANACGLR